MSAQERFSQEYGVPMTEVQQLVNFARRAGKANEHACNGDPHPSYPKASDKSFNSQRWGNIVDDLTQQIGKLMRPYGFTEIVYAGLYPTLKRGSLFVEIPF